MILQGDALAELRKLPDKCCSVCVTSPPYYNARDYGVADQLGTESSPEEYTRKMVEIFREVARVLKDDGTLWLNIGDSYARHIEDGGIKRKDLIGIPWLLALALRSDGWVPPGGHYLEQAQRHAGKCQRQTSEISRVCFSAQ